MKTINFYMFILLFAALLGCTKNETIPPVNPIKVRSVTLNKVETSILVHGTETLSARVAPTDAANQAIDWSTSNASIATVSPLGVVTAMNTGAATITATTIDGNHSASCLVKVSNTLVPVTGVTMNHNTATVKVGGTYHLTAVIVPTNATNQNLEWSASDPTIATVSPLGVLTALKDGLITITATAIDGGHKDTCAVTVLSSVVSVTHVSLNPETEALKIGQTLQCIATIEPTNATNTNVDWSTSNTSVATVSPLGVVTAMNTGAATITATTTDGHYKATCSVTVRSKGDVPVTGISLNYNTMNVYNTANLIATIEPANATNKNIKWSSSNPLVAVVLPSGLTTASNEGTTTITATAIDGNYTASCVVTVPVKTNPPTAAKYITIGQLNWAKGNLVAEAWYNNHHCKVGDPEDGGLYFQFGSLIGYKGGSFDNIGTGFGTPPTELGSSSNISSWWGYAPSFNFDKEAMVWPSKMIGNPGTVWPITTQDNTNTWFFSSQGVTTGEINVTNEANGVGDPCSYYLGEPWRLPTKEEYVTLIGANGANTNKLIPLKLTNSDLGFFVLGTRLSSSGAFANLDNIGSSWSRSIEDKSHGFALSFNKYNNVNPATRSPRSSAYSVRCVSPV